MAEYVLPELPYDYSALEPHISGQIMELHHDKHHQAYVTGANGALGQLAEARQTGQLGTVNLLEKNLAFNLAGHVNHTVFWPNMSPDGGTSRTETSPPPSMSSSARSTPSASTSPRPRWASRDRDGRSWRGTAWASS